MVDYCCILQDINVQVTCKDLPNIVLLQNIFCVKTIFAYYCGFYTLYMIYALYSAMPTKKSRKTANKSLFILMKLHTSSASHIFMCVEVKKYFDSRVLTLDSPFVLLLHELHQKLLICVLGSENYAHKAKTINDPLMAGSFLI